LKLEEIFERQRGQKAEKLFGITFFEIPNNRTYLYVVLQNPFI
jgi:hypothetical protein